MPKTQGNDSRKMQQKGNRNSTENAIRYVHASDRIDCTFPKPVIVGSTRSNEQQRHSKKQNKRREESHLISLGREILDPANETAHKKRKG